MFGITRWISKVYTGMRAEQLIKGATKMVVKRSCHELIVRADMMPGIAQAELEINGTTLLPFKPNGRINLSIMKTTRAIYPVSSRILNKKNNNAI